MDAELRTTIAEFLRYTPPPKSWPFSRGTRVPEDGYDRTLISYTSLDGDQIPAFLLEPNGSGPHPAVLVHHQHGGLRNLGKSEVCGLAGDSLQAFGPELAKRGVIVLAPDSIAFEDRRPGGSGMGPDPDRDSLQHYNALTYRLVGGDTLMRKVLSDSALAVSVLAGLPNVDTTRTGMVGHSYGGNTVLFHSALDERVRFACASGAACTYRTKIRSGTGLEMAEVIPGIVTRFDIDDLVRCIAPRSLLLVSASDDPYSADAEAIYESALPWFDRVGAADKIQHVRSRGSHALDQDRFAMIIAWTVERCLE